MDWIINLINIRNIINPYNLKKKYKVWLTKFKKILMTIINYFYK